MVNAQEWLDKNYPKNGLCPIETDDDIRWGSSSKGWNNKGKKEKK